MPDGPTRRHGKEESPSTSFFSFGHSGTQMISTMLSPLSLQKKGWIPQLVRRSDLASRAA
jgi:hypothetical protein